MPALLSPVWDMALACQTLLEVGDEPAMEAAAAGLKWLLPRQELDVVGDWSARRPNVRPGGWAFQFANRITRISTTPPSS